MGISKEYVLILIGVFVFGISLAVFFSSKTVAVQQNPLEECNVLDYNGEGKINIVYFAEEKEAEKYNDFLLSSAPFEDYKARFNAYFITPEQYKVQCELYKDIAVFCHSRELISKSASCPGNDFVVVLDDRDKDIRSSSYLNVISINKAHVLEVYLHEFGHAFANFAEEYVNGQNPPRGSENCQETCEDFEGDINGCYEGCSKSSFQRSISSGVMRTLNTDNYGTYNENFLRMLIEEKTSENNKGITGRQIDIPVNCGDEKYYLVELNSDAEVVRVTEHQGCSSTGISAGDFRYEIKENGEVISSAKFNMNLFTDVQDEESLEGEILRPETAFITTALGDSIETYDYDNNLVSSYNTEFAGAQLC